MEKELIRLNGRIQTNGGRCMLMETEYAAPIVVKCPGLGRALLRDIDGIRVTSGTPMVDTACETTGQFLDDGDCSQSTLVFGNVAELIVYSQDGVAIPVDLGSLGQLSQSELEDIEYFKRLNRPGDADEVKERYLRARQAW